MPGATTFYTNTAAEGLAAAKAFNNPQAYGTKPVLPQPVSTAPQAVAGAMQQGQTVYNQLPGYGASLGNIGANIGAETAGQLPQDVLTQIQQAAAERGIATGTMGSQNNDAAYLRALGLTSLDMTQRGQQNFQSILPTLPGAAISQNPNFYPSSAAATDVNSSNAIYQSAPDPAAAAQAAMQAANSGLAAGRGAASPLRLPAAPDGSGGGQRSPAGGGFTGANSSGYWVNGVFTPSGGGASTTDQVDKIIQSYSGTAMGVPAAQNAGGYNGQDFESGIPGQPGYIWEGQNVDTPAGGAADFSSPYPESDYYPDA